MTEVTDSDSLKYTLSYSGSKGDRFLTSIQLPNGKRSSLGYDSEARGYLTSVTDPLGQLQLVSYFKHGRLRAIGSLNESVSYSYSPTSLTKQSLSSSGKPLQFENVRFVDGYITEVRAGDGAPTDSAPGILLSKVARDPIGRITNAFDQFGNESKAHYNEDKSCATTLSNPGTSLYPTCIEAAGVKIQTTYGADGLPVKATRTDPAGKTSSRELSWESGKQKGEVIKDSADRITSERSVTYQDGLPTLVRTKTVIHYDEYDTVVKGRLKRFTDSSGIETSYAYGADGAVTSTTTGGISSSFTQELEANGSSSSSIVQNGVQQTFKSNFLNTQSSSAVSKSSSPAAGFSMTSSSTVQPGTGRVTSSQTSTTTAGGGKLSEQSTSTQSVDSKGARTSTGTSGVNIR